jgi:hypothetical protein
MRPHSSTLSKQIEIVLLNYHQLNNKQDQMADSDLSKQQRFSLDPNLDDDEVLSDSETPNNNNNNGDDELDT